MKKISNIDLYCSCEKPSPWDNHCVKCKLLIKSRSRDTLGEKVNEIIDALNDLSIKEREKETIPCIVQAKKNDTGEIRNTEMDIKINPVNGSVIFYLSDGKDGYNRAIDFYEAGGEKMDFDGKPCGDEEYSIRLTGKETGEVFYDEFDD